jgi:FkbH-like protein
VQSQERSTVRAEIDAALADGNVAAARAALLRLWSSDPSGATASLVVSRFEKLRGKIPLTPLRLAVLRSFTLEPLVPLLRACAFAGGIDLEIRLGDFNTFHQEIVDPASWLYTYEPQAIFLAVQLRDLAPGLWNAFADLSGQQAQSLVDQVNAQLAELINVLRSRSSAHVVIHSMQTPPAPAYGIFDNRLPLGQAQAVASINLSLAHLGRDVRNVYLLDYDALIARHGSAHWEDPLKWLTVRLPIAADRLLLLAREWMRFIQPICGKLCKCLVTDLDNTLWGGVIGEDGMEGIRLDSSPGGFAFQAVQRVLLDFHRRGILLAIASKNNPGDAKQAIESHPGMLLRAEHFAAMRINWNDKAASLREIAAELNIGIDSLAFLDDNPVERQWVAQQLPEVSVIELPAQASGYAAALREAPVFERLAVTKEDQERGRTYAEQRLRAELQSSSASLEDFYRSLNMEAGIGPMAPASLARVAQLTQKTNQFNLTTRRYSEEQIANLAADPAACVYTLRVRDRLGDSGLVGVAITRDQAGRCELDTLLMSCRVIGRTIETAFLAQISQDARRRGNTHLAGWFLPTRKNAPAQDFFASQGFSCVRKEEQGSYWELALCGQLPVSPPWIKLQTNFGKTPA